MKKEMLNKINEYDFYERVNVYMENPDAIFEDEMWPLFHMDENKTNTEMIEFLENHEVLEVEIDYFCEKRILSVYIAEVRLYAKDYKEKTNFDKDYVFNHGLDAFSKYGVLVNAKRILDNPKMELCCSFKEQYVGNIGLYLKGTCLCASNTDLDSNYDDKGRYIIDKEHLLIESEKDIKKGFTHHGEAILTDIKIVGIWCKSDANKKKVERLQEITGINSVIIV